MPTGRLQREMQDVRTGAERLSRQPEDVQHRDQQLAAQLQAQTTRLEATERDLRAEKEMNGRLHLLVSQGKK